MKIRKIICVQSDRTCCCIRKFNIVFSLCRVLEVALYFFKNFSETIVKALWSFGVTIVCFLEQESNLWTSALQQRYRLFSRYFLHLLLVNLLLLASLEKRSICRKLNYFQRIKYESLKGDNVVDKATRDVFALFQEAIKLLAVEVLSCFQK